MPDDADYIPDEVQWVFILIAGGNIPPGVVNDMRDQANRYEQFGIRASSAGDGVDRFVTGVKNNVNGNVADPFDNWARNLNDGMGLALKEMSDLQAKKLREQALNIESGRYGIWVQVIWTAWELLTILANPLLYAWYPIVVSFGQLMVRLIRGQVNTRTMMIILQRVSREIGKNGALKTSVNLTKGGMDDIVRKAAKEAGENVNPKVFQTIKQAANHGKLWMAGKAGKEVVDEAVEEVVQDGIVQVVQFAQGNRKDWDGKSTGLSAGLGGLGGAVGGVFQKGLTKTHKPTAKKWTGAGLVEGATEVVVGAVASAPSIGGEVDGIWQGAVNGAASGAGMKKLHDNEQQTHKEFLSKMDKLKGPNGGAPPPPPASPGDTSTNGPAITDSGGDSNPGDDSAGDANPGGSSGSPSVTGSSSDGDSPDTGSGGNPSASTSVPSPTGNGGPGSTTGGGPSTKSLPTASPSNSTTGPGSSTTGPSSSTTSPGTVTGSPSTATPGLTSSTTGPGSSTTGPSPATGTPSPATPGSSSSTTSPSNSTTGSTSSTTGPSPATGTSNTPTPAPASSTTGPSNSTTGQGTGPATTSNSGPITVSSGPPTATPTNAGNTPTTANAGPTPSTTGSGSTPATTTTTANTTATTGPNQTPGTQSTTNLAANDPKATGTTLPAAEGLPGLNTSLVPESTWSGDSATLHEVDTPVMDMATDLGQDTTAPDNVHYSATAQHAETTSDTAEIDDVKTLVGVPTPERLDTKNGVDKPGHTTETDQNPALGTRTASRAVARFHQPPPLIQTDLSEKDARRLELYRQAVGRVKTQVDMDVAAGLAPDEIRDNAETLARDLAEDWGTQRRIGDAPGGSQDQWEDHAHLLDPAQTQTPGAGPSRIQNSSYDAPPETPTVEVEVELKVASDHTSVTSIGLQVPGYVRQSRALGPIRAQADPVGARVAGLITNGLPGAHVDDVAGLVDTEFESFLGDGRRIQVQRAGTWYELLVRATMHLPPGPLASPVEASVIWSVSVHEGPAGIRADAFGQARHPIRLSGPDPASPRPVVVTVVGDRFTRIAQAPGQLSVTRLGAPGRMALQDFISATGIASRLPAMLSSGVTSPDLLSSDGTMASAVRTTASIDAGQLLSSSDGVGTYQVNATVTARTLDGTAVDIPVTAVMDMTAAEAVLHGLPEPEDPAPQPAAQQAQQPAQRQYLTPYLSDSLRKGNAEVTGIDLGNLQEQIETFLGGQPALAKFLPRWQPDGPRVADTAELRRMMDNQRALERALSREQATAGFSRMLEDGVQVRLKRRGPFTNDYVTVRVAAKLRDEHHTGAADGQHRFSAELDYDVTIEHYSRDRAWARRITPDRGVPTRVTLARTGPAADGVTGLDPVSGRVEIAASQLAVFDHSMDEYRPGPAEHDLLPEGPVGLDALMWQAQNAAAVTEWDSIEAVVGFEQVHDAAIAALERAALGNDSLTHEDTPSRAAIDALLTQENFADLVHAGLQDKDLRSGTRSGALGARADLVNPRLVVSDSPTGKLLVQADAVVDIRVRSQDLLGQSGSDRVQVTLPGAVFLTVTDEQARSMGDPRLLPPLPERPADVSPTSLAAPVTMRPNGPNPLGRGVYEQLPDLSGMLSRLRADVMAEMPDSIHNARSTLRQIHNGADPLARQQFMDSAFDGGAPLADGRFVLRAKAGVAQFIAVRNEDAGVAAHYEMPVEFELVTVLPDGTTGSTWFGPEDVTFALPADDQSITPEVSGDDLWMGVTTPWKTARAWKSEGIQLPESAFAEAVAGVGTLREAVSMALAEAGLPADPAHAIGAQSLPADLAEMIHGGKKLKDLPVEVHARLRAPLLGGMSDTARPDARSGLVHYDVDYRVEVRLDDGRTVVVESRVPSSAAIRVDTHHVADALGLPDTDLAALERAQDAVRDAENSWRSKEILLTRARRVAAETEARTVPRLQRAREKATETARGEAAALQQLEEQRRNLAQAKDDQLGLAALAYGDTALVERAKEAKFRAEWLAGRVPFAKLEFEKHERAADRAHALRDLLQTTVDAVEADLGHRTRDADLARAAWWEAKAELAEQMATVNSGLPQMPALEPQITLDQAADVVVASTAEQAARWRRYADERAEHHHRAARRADSSPVPAVQQTAGLHRLMELFHVEFAELAGALNRVPTYGDLLVLAQVLISPDATTITQAQVDDLAQLAWRAAERGPVSIAGVQHVQAIDALRTHLGATSREVGRYQQGLAAESSDHVVQAVALHRASPDLNENLTLQQVHRVLNVVRRSFPEQTGELTRIDSRAALLPLIRAVADPAATRVTDEQIVRLATAVDRVIRPTGKVRLKDLTRYFKSAATQPDGVDGADNQQRELRELGRHFEDLTARTLMAARRAYHDDPRSRGFTDFRDYAPMILELLGQTEPTPANMGVLATLVNRASTVVSPYPSRKTLIRTAIDTRWSAGPRPALPDPAPAAPGPDPQRAPADPDPDTPGPATAGGTPPDHGGLVPGLQYAKNISNIEALTTWLNGIIPGADGQITAKNLGDKLIYSFTAAMDEGMQVDTGGKEFTVELVARVAGRPTHNTTDPVPAAKLEQRVNSIEIDISRGGGRSTTGYLDIGATGRGGEGNFALGGTGTIGKSRTRNAAYMAGTAVGRYMYLKPDDKVGLLDVPVQWSARIRDTKTNRWQDFTFADQEGRPRTETVQAMVPLHQMPTTSPNRQDLTPDGFPFWDMHHGVERIRGVDGMRAAVRAMIGDENYTFWEKDINLFLSNDRIGTVLGDAHNPDRTWQQIPKLNLRSRGRYLNLALTATAQSMQDIGKPSKQVKYDQLSQSIHRTASTREPRSGNRLNLAGRLRAFSTVLSAGARYAGTRLAGRPSTRGQTGWLLRAMRAQDPNQVVKLNSLYTVHADSGRDDKARVPDFHPRPPDHRDIRGFAHVRVRGSQLTKAPEPSGPDQPGETPEASGPEKFWWTPALNADYGIGYGTVKKLTGMQELYNPIVRELVRRELLPAEALGTGDLTPWQHLVSLPPTGAALNKPGRPYSNWRLLVEQLSAEVLTRRIDDLMGGGHGQPGVPLVFGDKSGNEVTIGLSAKVTGPGRYVQTDKLMPVNTFVALDQVSSRRAGIATHAGGGDIGAIGDPGGDEAVFDAPLGGFGGGTYARRRQNRTGESSSSTVMAYARTEGDTSLFELPITFTWSVHDGNAPVFLQREVEATMQVWQPDSLNDRVERRDPLPPLKGLPLEVKSPLIGMVARAPISVSGIADLQQALIAEIPVKWDLVTQKGLYDRQQERLHVHNNVWSGVTTVGYKTNLSRVLAAGYAINVGQLSGKLKATPVGRPQILKALEGKGKNVYTEVMQESQAGLDVDDDFSSNWGYRAGAGYRTGLARDHGDVMGGQAWGKGQGAGRGRTEGLFRSLTGTDDMYVVRTLVGNTVTLQDGTSVATRGEVVLLVAKSDVLAKGTDLFDDPYDLLTADLPKKPAVVRRPPQSLRDGRLWTAVWVDTVGEGALAEALSEHARQLGGVDLQNAVDPLLTGLSVRLPQLTDGGHSWLLRANGRKYELTITATPIGDAEHIADSSGGGLKLYTRANISGTDRERRTKVNQVIATGGPGFGDASEGPSATILASASRQKTQDKIGTASTNLLTMDGERPKGTTEFRQEFEFTYTLKEVPSFIDPPSYWRAGQDRTGAEREHRSGHVPTDGTTVGDSTPHTWQGKPRDLLPADVVIHGVQGLSAIDEVARADKSGKSLAPGSLSPDESVLNRETLLSRFRQMLTVPGADFAAVHTAKGQFKLPNGMRVNATFSAVNQLYYVPTVELEHYDHGTTTVGNSASTTRRFAADVSANVPIPVDSAGMIRFGPRVAAGADRTVVNDPGSVTRSTEHRAWLRRMMGAFHLYMPVSFTVTTSGGRRRTVQGAVEIVVTEDGAIEMGIPADVLKRAKDKPAAKQPVVTVPGPVLPPIEEGPGPVGEPKVPTLLELPESAQQTAFDEARQARSELDLAHARELTRHQRERSGMTHTSAVGFRTPALWTASHAVARYHRQPPVQQTNLSAEDSKRVKLFARAVRRVAAQVDTDTEAGLDPAQIRKNAEKLSYDLAVEWGTLRRTGGAPPGAGRDPSQQDGYELEEVDPTKVAGSSRFKGAMALEPSAGTTSLPQHAADENAPDETSQATEPIQDAETEGPGLAGNTAAGLEQPAMEPPDEPRDIENLVEQARKQHPEVTGIRDGEPLRRLVRRLAGVEAGSTRGKHIDTEYSDENLAAKFGLALETGHWLRFGGLRGTEIVVRAQRVTRVAAQDSRGPVEAVSDESVKTEKSSGPGRGASGPAEWRLPTPVGMVVAKIAGIVNSRASTYTAHTAKDGSTKVVRSDERISLTDNVITYAVTVRKGGFRSPARTEEAEVQGSMRWTHSIDTPLQSPHYRAGTHTIVHAQFSGLNGIFQQVQQRLGGFVVGDPAVQELNDWLKSLPDKAEGLFGDKVASKAFQFKRRWYHPARTFTKRTVRVKVMMIDPQQQTATGFDQADGIVEHSDTTSGGSQATRTVGRSSGLGLLRVMGGCAVVRCRAVDRLGKFHGQHDFHGRWAHVRHGHDVRRTGRAGDRRGPVRRHDR